MRTGLDLTCEHCGIWYHRPRGDEGRGRFCSVKCGRAAQPRTDPIAGFWRKVDKSGDCWVWTGTHGPFGYGIVKNRDLTLGQNQRNAHRVAWELTFGPIPPGLFVCHACDNPPCVRPTHLFLGTAAANSKDRDRKGRQRSPRGEAVATTRLTDSKVIEMRQRRADGVLLRDLATEYGVAVSVVHAAVSRKTWKHVP